MHLMPIQTLEQMDSTVTLTAAQQQLIRAALQARDGSPLVSPTQRSAIRDLCASVRREREREKLLIEFKIALASAANEEGIPYGPERSDAVSRLVSVFIDELYRMDGDGGSVSDAAATKRAGAGKSRLSMENDSRDARL